MLWLSGHATHMYIVDIDKQEQQQPLCDEN